MRSAGAIILKVLLFLAEEGRDTWDCRGELAFIDGAGRITSCREGVGHARDFREEKGRAGLDLNLTNPT